MKIFSDWTSFIFPEAELRTHLYTIFDSMCALRGFPQKVNHSFLQTQRRANIWFVYTLPSFFKNRQCRQIQKTRWGAGVQWTALRSRSTDRADRRDTQTPWMKIYILPRKESREKAVLGFFRIRQYILNCSINWNFIACSVSIVKYPLDSAKIGYEPFGT